MELPIKIKKLREDATLPTYAKKGDACLDVKAVSIEYDEEMDCYIYGTGLSFELPEGYDMKIFPRSSNRKTDCYMANHVGVLDSGYRGELMVSFKPRTSKWVRDMIETLCNTINRISKLAGFGSKNFSNSYIEFPYNIGDKIAQVQINRYPTVVWNEVDKLGESERGTDGHGSTGK